MSKSRELEIAVVRNDKSRAATIIASVLLFGLVAINGYRLLTPLSQLTGTLESLTVGERFINPPFQKTVVKVYEYETEFWTYHISKDKFSRTNIGSEVVLNVHMRDVQKNYMETRTFGLMIGGDSMRNRSTDLIRQVIAAFLLPGFLLIFSFRQIWKGR